MTHPHSPEPTGRPTSPRIHGLDIARAVAIIGMMAAHLGPWAGRPALAEPATWPAVANGYPSALFAVLAGVSIGIIARKGVAAGGVELLRSRMRLGARAVILIALGLVLASLQSEVMVVLVPMGAMFLVVLPLVTARTTTVAGVAAALAVLGPLVMAPAGAVVALAAGFLWSALVPALGVGVSGADLDVAWDDGMGGVNWAASVGPPIVDAALDPELPAVPGTALEAAESGAAASGAGMGTGERLLGAFVDGSAHASGLLDVVGAAAASLAAIAVLLMVGRTRIGAAALHPLRMMGLMSLTVYVAHVVGFPVIDLAGLAVPAIAEVEPETWLIASIIAAMLFAVAWKAGHRRGPLEEIMHRAAERAARIDVPASGRAGGTS